MSIKEFKSGKVYSESEVKESGLTESEIKEAFQEIKPKKITKEEVELMKSQKFHLSQNHIVTK